VVVVCDRPGVFAAVYFVCSDESDRSPTETSVK